VREEIWSCLKALREYGLTIIVIDKYIKRLIGFADQHTILEKGEVAGRFGAAVGADGIVGSVPERVRRLLHRY
jgi:ABC-type branched-subunit amino acid transport system ATPase component